MGVEWFQKALLLVMAIGYSASQDVPAPPRLVSVTCGDSQATVHWQPPENSDRPITAYYIQQRNSFILSTWETILPKVAANETQHKVSLSPWMNYTFRVVASNHAGPSQPSEVSTECSTPPDVPFKNPDNVKGEGLERDNIVITWDHMDEAEQNGPGFVYRVYWKLDDPGEQWSSADIYDWRQTEMLIPDQPSFSRYRIKVAALNRVGEAPPPQEVIGYSGEGVPTQAPGNLRILYADYGEVVVSWDPVDVKSIQGRDNGYKIEFFDGYKMKVQQIRTRPRKTRAFLSVHPDSTIFVRVSVRNGRYTGPHNELTFHTPEGAPGPVQSFEAYQLGSSAFYLTWRRPYTSNGDLTGYRIFYRTVNKTTVGDKKHRASLVPSRLTRGKLSGLQPNTQYRLYIAATTKTQEGAEYFIERSTGPNVTVKPDIPQFSWLQESLVNGLARIRIVWLPDVEGTPGSHFFVKRRLKGQTEFTATEPELDEDFMIVNDLDPCRTYEFQLVAVDGEFTTESAVKEVTVDAVLKCDVAENELEN